MMLNINRPVIQGLRSLSCIPESGRLVVRVRFELTRMIALPIHYDYTTTLVSVTYAIIRATIDTHNNLNLPMCVDGNRLPFRHLTVFNQCNFVRLKYPTRYIIIIPVLDASLIISNELRIIKNKRPSQNG